MSRLRTGWYVINTHILEDGFFKSGANWLIRSAPGDGRDDFTLSTLLSMAVMGNGNAWKHYAGARPCIHFVAVGGDYDTIVSNAYRELCNYLDLTKPAQQSTEEMMAYIQHRLGFLSFEFVLDVVDQTYTAEQYRERIEGLAANKQVVVASAITGLLCQGDSTAILDPYFQLGPEMVQIISVASSVTTDTPEVQVADVTITGELLSLRTPWRENVGVMTAKLTPSMSVDWIREEDNPALLENRPPASQPKP